MRGGVRHGLCFSLQNNDLLQSGGETGCATKALNLSFRTYGSTPSDTFMELRDGSTVLKTANLKAVGFDFGYNPAAAGQYAGRYTMHVDYVPRDLDVYINDTLVFDSVNVDLETLANGSAVDADGKAYIGFSARTGGATENHDILNLRLASYVRATLGSLFICK